MKKTKSKENEFILSYFKKINLEQGKDIRQLKSLLYSKYDKNLVEALIEILENRVDWRNSTYFHEIKNTNLDLSVDFASYFTDFYRRYFEWLMKKETCDYKRILDIGCDNGIVTCFLGILFPGAEIIGIDTSSNGIECGKQLADKLKLTNVSFTNIDFVDVRKHFPSNHFDMITSVRTINETAEFEEERKYWSLYDNKEFKKNRTVWVIFSLIKKLLKDDNSEFIALEKLTNPIDAVLWAAQLEEVELYIDWNETSKIKFYEAGIEQTMPIIVSKQNLSSSSTVENVIKLFSGIENIDTENNKELDGYAAEITFNRFKNKEFINGIQINYTNGLGSLRYELWRDPLQLILYQYNNVGYRKLSLVNEQYLGQIKGELSKLKETISAKDNSVFSYTEIQNNNK